AAGTLQDADIAAELVNLDCRLGGVVTDEIHDVARFREGLSRREPSSTCRDGGRRHAAQTESAARHDVLRKRSHEFLLTDPANSAARAPAVGLRLCHLG